MGFFTPKWLTDKEKTAKLEDDKKLKRAYEMGENMDVRLTAIGKIEDSEFLYGILEEATPEEQKDWTEEKSLLVTAVVKRLGETDRSLLLKGLADLKHYSNDRGRVQTIIKDALKQRELYELLNSCDDMTAIWIAEELEAPNLLKKIFLEKGRKQPDPREKRTIRGPAWTDTDETIANLVAEKITDKKTCLKILKELSGRSFKGLMILRDRLSDDDLLAAPETIMYVREEERLKELIFDKRANAALREAALKNMKDAASVYPVLKDRKFPSDGMRRIVMEIDDPAVLYEIMEEDYPTDVKMQVLFYKSFPEDFYKNLAWNSENKRIRRQAVNEIKDREELEKIRDGIEDEKLKQCACGKLGHDFERIRDWNEHARHGRGYRSHTLYRCRICGAEAEEVYEHDS
ncbi:MAG: hypothetical protein IJH71_10900 [Eubacterium sp.]|nr:hypothetical protein [Eubacterium sp.]